MSVHVPIRESAGREWAYQLRELAAELEADGQGTRARELARMAEATEAEVAGLHAEAMERLTRPEPRLLRRAI